MKCANSQALRVEENRIEKMEKAEESFLDSIDDLLVEHSLLVGNIKKIAKNYNGYDFTESVTELLKDEI